MCLLVPVPVSQISRVGSGGGSQFWAKIILPSSFSLSYLVTPRTMPPGSSRVKRHRRAEAAAVELGEQAASIRELDALAAQSNEDLFLVDRGGSKTARTKIAAKAGTSSVIQSATEKKLVQRIVKSIKAADGAVRGEQGSSSLSDLWGGDEEVAAPPKNTKAITTRVASEEKKTKTSKTSAKRDSAAVVSIAKARAGQSYHPEPSQHQAILAEVSQAIVKTQYLMILTCYIFHCI